MHILIIPSWYTSRHRPINGIFFKEQAEILAKNNEKVGVISPLFRTARNLDHTFNESFYGVSSGVHTYTKEIWHYPYLHKSNTKHWFNTCKVLFAKYILEQGKPDIIHIHSVILAGNFARYIKKKYGIPFVLTEHASGFVIDVYKRQIGYYQEIIKESSYNIAVSPSLAQVLTDKLGGEWVVVPNIIQEQFIYSGRKNLLVKNNDVKVFLSVGVLLPVKGFDLLIEAFKKILVIRKDFKLRIGGEGSERKNLEKIIFKNKLQDHVQILGLLDREQVQAEMRNATFFISSSLSETFGVVLIEALAMGLPVVATKCGGPEYIVSPEVGILVENNSMEALFVGMSQIIENEENYIPNDIIDYCENNFSEKVVSEKILNIYRAVLYG